MSDASFDPGPLADVRVEASGEQWTLVFVRELRHPPETVWAALTDPGQLAAWSPFTADRDLGTTGDATLTMIDDDAHEDLRVVVVVADPPDVLQHTWDTDVLRWELTAIASGTRLTLRHTLPDRTWVPKAAAGWHLCLVVAERLLDGKPIKPIVGSTAKDFGWEELERSYGATLGIASTGWPL